MFNSKKGMSPLIATVFLIAFAVSLGVMIMNWNPEDTESQMQITSGCKKLKIDFEGVPCYKDNSLVFTVKNVGESKIDIIKVKTSGGEIESEQTIKSSSMIVTESITKNIPFLYDQISVVTFIPGYLEQGVVISCPEAGKSISKLNICS